MTTQGKCPRCKVAFRWEGKPPLRRALIKKAAHAKKEHPPTDDSSSEERA